MSGPYPPLNPAEIERLSMLAEEAGEIVQAVGKILRHGYLSHHPDAVAPDEDHAPPNNRNDLEAEINDLIAVAFILGACREIEIAKPWPKWLPIIERKLRYTHYQPPLSFFRSAFNAEII